MRPPPAAGKQIDALVFGYVEDINEVVILGWHLSLRVWPVTGWARQTKSHSFIGGSSFLLSTTLP